MLVTMPALGGRMAFQGPAGGRRLEVVIHFHEHFSSSRPVVTAAMFGSPQCPQGFCNRVTLSRRIAHGMADYMRAANWDRGTVQDCVHGPKRRTIRDAIRVARLQTVPELGHRVLRLGLGSRFSGDQRAKSFVVG